MAGSVTFAQEVVGNSLMYVEGMVMALLFLGVVAWIGRAMSNDLDRSWLTRYIAWGYIVKLFGALARFWMVTVLYGGGDSFDYQFAGERFANIWRGFVVPVSEAGGEGTAFTEVATGFLYAFYTPSFLGGFILFATLCFFGQLLFIAAFRRWFGPEKQKLYTIAILFYPSLIFWPSSIGKDALMVLFLGLAAYGASRLLATYKITSLLFIGAGLILAAGIRPHVAGIMAIAFVLAMIFGKPMPHLRGSPMRPVLLVGAVLAAGVVLTTFSTTFEVGLEPTRTSTDVEGFLEEVSDRTGTGGSEIEGVAVTTPSQVPLAIITVLFRPLIHEGANPQMIISALEGTILLGFVILRLPQIWRNKGLLRRRAYMTMAFFYTGGFIIAFSAIHNLGILARQRVQVLPMLLALLVGMAWPEPDTKASDKSRAVDEIDPARTLRPLERELVGDSTAIARTEELVSPAVTGTEQLAESRPQQDKPPAKGRHQADEPEPNRKAAQSKSKKKKGRRRGNRPKVRDRIRSDVVELYLSDSDMPVQEIARAVDASASSVRRVLSEEGLK